MSKVSVAIIADTHMPKGGRQLPERCLELLAEAEAIVHAGDISSIAVLREIEAIGPPVHAVHGNVDEPGVCELLPATLRIELLGRPVAVVHDSGTAQGRLRRLAARFPEAELVIFGHSHLPLHERSDSLQIFNPGSPTERRRAPQRSMGWLNLTGDELHLEHIWLGVA
jgi:putative phosphoesterase